MRLNRCWPAVATLALVAFAGTAALAATPPKRPAAAPAPGASSPRTALAPGHAAPESPMAAVQWEQLPQPDTAAAFATGRFPGTPDTLAEVVLDDGGVSFGADGVVAMMSTRVYLPLSPAGAEQLRQVQSLPRAMGGKVVAFVLHDNGTREFGQLSVSGQVTFRAVIPGDLVVVCSRLARPALKPGVCLPFSSASLLQGGYPVRTSHFWARYPANRPAGVRAVGLPEPRTTVAGNTVTKEWRAEKLERMLAEEDPVAPLEGAPVVFLDSNPDPDWLAPLCRGYLRLPAGPRLKRLVAQIQVQYHDPAARLEAARDYAAHKLAPLDQEFTWPDTLRRLTPDGVLRRGAAGTFGRLVLLAALLQELGFEPGIAVVDRQLLWRRPPVLSPDLVSCMVVAPWNKPVLWLNPNSVAAPSRRPEVAAEGRTAVIIGPNSSVELTVPTGPREARGTAAAFTGFVDSSGVVAGELRLALRGEDADAWRATLRTASVADANRAAQTLAALALYGAETMDVRGEGFETAGDTAVLVSRFRARDLVDVAGDLRRLSLSARLAPEMVRTPRRSAHSLMKIYGEHRETLDLTLPRGWTLAGGADSASGGERFLRWSETRRVAGGRLHVERSLSVLQPEMAAADLDAYLAEQDAMNHAFDRQVVFRAAP